MASSLENVRKLAAAALVAIGLPCAGGCANWQSSKWDMSQLRDSRATDLERRLDSRPSPVANPFSNAAEDTDK